MKLLLVLMLLDLLQISFAFLRLCLRFSQHLTQNDPIVRRQPQQFPFVQQTRIILLQNGHSFLANALKRIQTTGNDFATDLRHARDELIKPEAILRLVWSLLRRFLFGQVAIGPQFRFLLRLSPCQIFRIRHTNAGLDHLRNVGRYRCDRFGR
uniref:Putative secreted protein n=1 Tax=Anopheles triannulatus TaxID=58253 RepID=A0A2M4B606_9DIPT